MSFPRYPAYKDSGVEWLGQVPDHWSVRRLGYYFSERRDKVSDLDFPALSVTKYGIVPQLATAAKTDDGDNRRKVLNGDFVINSRSDRKGSSGISDRDGSVSLICTVLQPHGSIVGAFVHHLFRSVPFQEEYYRYGKGIVADLWSTNYGEMKNILLAFPPEPEQRQLAAFLDHETAKIDALIAEQQRLIELLHEKRQAVISHAVSKGLNPNVTMKPSGVEWLGDVPAHWQLLSAKRVAEIFVPQRNKPDLNSDQLGIPWVTMDQIHGDVVSASELFVSESAANAAGSKVLASGAVVASCVGTFGVCAISCEAVIINQQLQAFIPGGKISAIFLKHFVSSAVQYFESIGTAATLSYVNQAGFATLPVLLPSLDEQWSITEFIDRERSKIDALEHEAKGAIDLLQQRRSALISAAVTGQIDVRGFASQVAA